MLGVSSAGLEARLYGRQDACRHIRFGIEMRRAGAHPVAVNHLAKAREVFRIEIDHSGQYAALGLRDRAHGRKLDPRIDLPHRQR